LKIKVLAITAFFLVGCATGRLGTSGAANRLSMEQAEERIDQTEDDCIEETAVRAEAQMSNVVMTVGYLTQLEMGAVFLNRDAAWSQCLANADKGKDAIAARDRTLYENAEALDRKVPLPVLTMSLSP